MKLLFDQNLSPRLCQRLVDEFPGSAHVSELGLGEAPDEVLWAFARSSGFTLVTKDADFSDLVILRGFPPKVLWLRLGNCTTSQVAALLRAHAATIRQLEDDPSIGILSLF